MGYADQKNVVKTHVTAAAAALPNPIRDVAEGFLPAVSRSGRIYYGGETEPPRIGGQRTLTEEMVGETIRVTFYWALSGTGAVNGAVIETELVALKHDIRTRVLADSQLGGNSLDLEMAYAEAGFTEITGTAYRTLDISFLTDHIAYPIGA